MHKRFLIMMSILVAAPAAAQDGEVSTEGELDAEVSGGVEAEMDADADTDAEMDVTSTDDADSTIPDGNTYAEEAAAADPYAFAYTQRSLTVPHGTLRIDFGPADRALLQRGGLQVLQTDFSDMVPGAEDTLVSLSVGVAFGLWENLELGAIVLPLQISPDVDYINPSIYGRYQILEGDFQLGAQASALVPVQPGADFQLALAIPIKYILKPNVHINTGVQMEITFGDDTSFGLSIPVELAMNFTEQFFAGVTTGIVHPSFDVGDPSLQAGVFAGYTIPMGQGMLLDATIDFSLPSLVQFGEGDTFNPDIWQFIVGAVARVDIFK